MADGILNVARGRIRHYCQLTGASDGLVVVLLKSAGLQSDDTLADHDDLAALLAASNDEADFTNYARKTVTTATITVDDTNNWVDISIANQVWIAAGGVLNNTLGKALLCYKPDTTLSTDAEITPLVHFGFVATTDGTDLPLDFPASGFYRTKAGT
jgi:hypothetical protein